MLGNLPHVVYISSPGPLISGGRRVDSAGKAPGCLHSYTVDGGYLAPPRGPKVL